MTSALDQIVNFIITISLCISVACATLLVNIKNGTLEGITLKTQYDREFYAFRSIPYALPPIGKLRFRPAQPSAGWSGVRPAIDDAPICTQRNVFLGRKEIDGSEDCLYLNVYSPQLVNLETKNPQALPVMVWIHGGGWLAGSGNADAFGPEFLLNHDIVLVTINYRLGPLGFLSTQDTALPGNLGMKDQVLALKWVQENIDAFGGDPNSVTIFGESAGGASVHYHIISPLSKGLFHRAISQSGTAVGLWGLTKSNVAKNHAQRLAAHVGCPKENSIELVNCLREKDAREITGAEEIFEVFQYDPAIPFRVVVEPDHPDAFIIEEPIKLLRAGQVADVPWLTGLTSHEGALKVSLLFDSRENNFVKILDDKWMELAPVSLLVNEISPHEEDHIKIVKDVREFYFGDKELGNSTKWNLIDLYSDSWFNLGTDLAVRAHLESLSSPVFFYYFAYRGAFSFSEVFGNTKEDFGVSHCDELLYLFPLGDPKTAYNKQDREMADTLTTLWYNFAKTGNPTPKITAKLPTKWKPVRTDAHEYLLIENPHSMKMSHSLNPYRTQFWKNILRYGEKKSTIGKHSTKTEL